MFETPAFANGSSDPSTRPMAHSDMEKVRVIDRDAFERYRRQHNQLQRPLQLRTRENIDAAFDRPYPGVVVEWPTGTIAGYCFTHVWGSLGWLGTLGVMPRRQGAGLGRMVTRAGLDLLRETGCTTLALETMPESGKNLAMYAGLGLEGHELTVLCQGSPRPATRTFFRHWDGELQLGEIAGQICPGLDPTPAARWLQHEDAGSTLVWHENGTPVAFAIIRTTPRRAAGFQSSLTIEAAGCLPEAREHWPGYVREMQSFAQDLGKNGVVFPVNMAQHWLLDFALDQGMRIMHTRARMLTGAPMGDADAILMLTLAM